MTEILKRRYCKNVILFMKYLTNYNNSLQLGYIFSIIVMKMATFPTMSCPLFLAWSPIFLGHLFFYDSYHNDGRRLNVNENIFWNLEL